MSTDTAQPIPDKPGHALPADPQLPYALIQLKQDLTVWLLKAREEWMGLEHKEKYNQRQAAKLAGCSRSTLRLAIKNKKLETLPSGWVTRDQVTAWRGYDPIQVKINRIASLEKDLVRVTNEIEQIITSANIGHF